MCKEGGCGVCTVTVIRPELQQPEQPVNSVWANEDVLVFILGLINYYPSAWFATTTHLTSNAEEYNILPPPSFGNTCVVSQDRRVAKIQMRAKVSNFM